ncbi:hypothetical protein PI95_030985 [Hassallia byssoidea VB512170]|uniref:Uncharacterized protein n=1 Tax=Hassallia byssoidea VB512170 TaxID=1304833 RepID=A0A846HHJ2_9CYAN|nr:hypothetical protein [Hassalia byssoidea]NEU76815.1 hypothetical protein [Hassalia byssoidea VB512170]
MLFKFKSTAQRGITKIEEKAVKSDVGEDNYKYQAFRDSNRLTVSLSQDDYMYIYLCFWR